MNRDPFYSQIEAALAGPLDSEQFEQCAVDLLRSVYPPLVPIRGGHDGGRDGETSTLEGGSLFLVTTIGDPSANLRKNLRSHRASARDGRLCLLATRHVLNASARSQLERLAVRLGYRLLRVHDGADFADRLYQSPQWCRALLQLTGSPPALATLPITHRPFVQAELIGRADDLDWLRSQRNDALLVGQPGSGKTFLLSTWARENNGLFVRTKNPTLIAEGLRSQKPSAIILDDAHLDPEFVVTLRQIRSDLGAEFQIVANAWPGDADLLRRNLQLTKSEIHVLGLLPRDKIVEVVRQAGIVGPTELVREIVTQAHGRPGLAVTLTHLCLRNGGLEVVLGEELAREVTTTFGRLLGEKTVPLLATFALGGRVGMRPSDVAATLGMNSLELQTAASRLAAGGVVEQRGEYLRVLPEPLRFALVRDIFFTKPSTLPVEALLAVAPDADATTRVLIFAKGRGAALPPDLLKTRILQSRSTDLKSLFSSLGETEAKWVLEEFSSELLSVADVGLTTAPKEYLRCLFFAATQEPNHEIEQNRRHPLRIVRDWIRSAVPGSGAALPSRHRLLDEAEFWLDEEGDYQVGMRALCAAFDPNFETNFADPGIGNNFTHRFGLLSADEARVLSQEWPRVLRRLDWTRIRSWRFLADTISQWLTPNWIRPGAESYKATREAGWDMLCAFADTAPTNISVQRWAKERAQRYKKKKQFFIPSDVEALFPTRDFTSPEETIARRSRAIEELAKEWSNRSPAEVALRWKEIVSAIEAGDVDTWGESMSLALQIAPRVQQDNLIRWAEEMATVAIAPDFIAPLWERIGAERPNGWEETIVAALSNPLSTASAFYALLPQANLPSRIEMLISAAVVEYPKVLGLSCLRARVPEYRLCALLEHSDSRVVKQVAQNMWRARPEGSILACARDAWETAIATHFTGEESSLADIFKREPIIGLKWLRNQIIRNSLRANYGTPTPIQVVVDGLNRDTRVELVNLIQESYFNEELVSALVGNDPEVYAALLHRSEIHRLHAVPLHGQPTEEWAALARVALTSGWDAERIAHASWGGPGGWSGSESKHWGEWESAFVKLRDCAPDLSEVAEFGALHFGRLKDQALRSEQRHSIFSD